MSYPAPFIAWTKHVAKWEGGWANRPFREDPGGATNRGVTFETWKGGAAKIVGKPPTIQGLRSLTAAEAEKIAFVMFWKGFGIDRIKNPGLQLLAADAVWGSGYYGIPSLCKWQARNADQLNNLFQSGRLSLSQAYGNRVAWLRSLPNAPFNPGWFPRMNDVFRLSKEWAGKLAVPAGVTLLTLAAVYMLYKYGQTF